MREFIGDLFRFASFCIGGLSRSWLDCSTPSTSWNLCYLPNQVHMGTRTSESQNFLALSDIEALDIVILGSSTCYRGIDPYHFTKANLNSFNLCSSSQSLFNSKHLLKWSLKTRRESKSYTCRYLSENVDIRAVSNLAAT